MDSAAGAYGLKCLVQSAAQTVRADLLNGKSARDEGSKALLDHQAAVAVGTITEVRHELPGAQIAELTVQIEVQDPLYIVTDHGGLPMPM